MFDSFIKIREKNKASNAALNNYKCNSTHVQEKKKKLPISKWISNISKFTKHQPIFFLLISEQNSRNLKEKYIKRRKKKRKRCKIKY